VDRRTEETRERARHYVYERLAFASAAIWAGGTAILFFLIVPYIEHPQAYIAVAMLIPLPVAALPWLFYNRLTETVARRWTDRGSK
jgi:hypothetical protein